MSKAKVIQGNKLQEVDSRDVDVEFLSPNQFVGSHVNLIPMHNAVQSARLFYGGRFYDQALPLKNREAPLVQNLADGDERGRSFDEIMGERGGALYGKEPGIVKKVEEGRIIYENDAGERREVSLYNKFPFNRKSVTGDTEVYIRNGEFVRRLKVEDYEFTCGDEILSVDNDTGHSVWALVDAFIEHKNDKQLFRVVYQSGRHVDVTEDHSLITMAPDGNLQPILPELCEEGYTRSPVAFLPEASGGSEKDYKMGLLVGLYLAEGWVSKKYNNGVYIAVESPESRIEECRDLVRGVLGVEPHNGDSGCNFSDAEFSEYIKANCGRGSGGKYISDSLQNSNRQMLLGLIHGYMGGDGCLWGDANGAIQLTGVSTSKRLRDDLVLVLQRLGVFSTLWDAPRTRIKKEWNDAYGFRISNSHIHKLGDVFFYKDRVIKLRTLLKDKYRAGPFDHIPLPWDLRKSIYSSFKGDVPHFIKKSVTAGKVAKWRLRGLENPLTRWVESEVVWDPIVSVNAIPHQDKVYDFSVDKTESFAVNGGLLVHNTSEHHTPRVKPGDRIDKDSLLATSNYTDDKGTLALGLNARVAVVPYKGYSVEDAIVVSDDFAKRLTSEHTEQFNQDFDQNTKGGKDHFRSLFPTKFKQKQLDVMDDDGVVLPGTVLNPGDPMILATQPRVLSSSSIQSGKLSKVMRQARTDSSTTWEGEEPGKVVDVVRGKKGVRVVVESEVPSQESDKIVFRSGNKAIISKILPRDKMPRTLEGEPMDVLLNPLSLPSRVNSATTLELALGKVARKLGKPIKIPAFNGPTEKWYEQVEELQRKHGVKDKEQLYDPVEDKIYQNPVQVGDGYILKLHHVGAGKRGERGIGSYDQDEQPVRGGGENAQAKRLSGLETQSMLSSGAYANLREGATVRGQKNDEFWRALRTGQPVKYPGEPFVWGKFQALLAGAGIEARKMDGGKIRLGPMTDRELERRKAVRVNKGELVNPKNLEPIPGGLFDPDIVSANKWGYIDLPFPVVNPAFEDSILKILGLTKQQFRDVLAGRSELPGR
jgi:intein/homing endonuclease